MVVYSQNDPAWKDNKIGFDQGPYDTIGNYGCYMTGIANVCSWAGNDINPQQINDICKDRGWLVSSDLVARDDVPSQLCSNLQFEGRTNWSSATPMDFFADASDPNVAYIICIDASKAPGIQTHFVMVWATNGPNDLIIDDSWDGQRKSLTHYGTPSDIIQSATKFRKDVPVVPPAPEPVVVPEPAPAPPTPYVPPAGAVPVTRAEKYELFTTLPVYESAEEVAKAKNPVDIIQAGTYYVWQKKGTNNNYWDLSTSNMDDQNKWININDNKKPLNVPAAVKQAPAPTGTAVDWASLFTPFPDGKSHRYVAVRDMYLFDLAAKDAKGINVNEGETVPIFGTVTSPQDGSIWLIPRMADDTTLGQAAPKSHYYGIPTSSIYTGLPNMKSQQYIDALAKAEVENRVYRKSVHHETTADKFYYTEQIISRAVKDGVRFISEVIPLNKLKALYGQKDKK